MLNSHFVNPPSGLSINWNPPETAISAFNVPRSIHYIWVGEKRIPNVALRNIYRMVQVNCSKSFRSYKIFVWTDSTKKILDSMDNAEKSDDLILSELARRSNNTGAIKIKHYSVLFKCTENKDIVDHKVKVYLEGVVMRNLYGPFRNYACASDIIRLFALNLGGIYLDVDVSVIDEIPESYLTNEHGLKAHALNMRLFNNYMISAPNDWIIKNILNFMCLRHKNINSYYSDRSIDTDNKLSVMWHQQRWLKNYIDQYGHKRDRLNLTINTTGAGLYTSAYLSIYADYTDSFMIYEDSFITARNNFIISGDAEQLQLLFLNSMYVLNISCILFNLRILTQEEIYSRYMFSADVFNNHEDPEEYNKPLNIDNLLELPEASKPFFAHGVVKGMAPSGDNKKLDPWCVVDMKTKHHDTSDIPINTLAG